MEITQVVLASVIIILTVVLTFIGVEVFFILREFRETVRKTNKIIDDAGLISESIAKPIVGLSGFLTGLKSGAGLIKILTKNLGKDEGPSSSKTSGDKE